MMLHEREDILIAGMGVTGRSVADYLSRSGLDYKSCDDDSDKCDACSSLSGDFNGYVLKSPGMPLSALGSTGAGSDVINDVELFMRLCLKPMILVTGTNGKSTVVALLEHIFKRCGRQAIACGNNGTPVLDAYSENQDIYIIELSSYQLEGMKSLQSDASVVLNIGVDHVDRYKDMEAYQETKEKIYIDSTLPVYPIDQSDKRTFSNNIQGYKANASEGEVVYTAGSDGLYRNGDLYIQFENLLLKGRHNHLNICAALCLCQGFGLDKDRIKDAVCGFSGLEHRLEVTGTDSKNRLWVNDSKSTNVHSTDAAIAAYKSGLVLIMGGKGKGEDYSALFDEYHRAISALVVYGEDAALILSQAGLISNKTQVSTVPEAVEVADRVAKDAAVVLFSPGCSSFDQYSNFEQRGAHFKQCVMDKVIKNDH